jgi:asparagine synthase (glutamine-hydrolysing)
MCGICGVLTVSGDLSEGRLLEDLGAMAQQLSHRGPDDEGAWIDAAAGIGLAHRRLAILDLSHHGHQPMQSADGRYVLTFNGEIYNFSELRQELAKHGYPFRGGSDTEVVLAAFSEWGLERTLPQLNGMFAFALWNRETRELSLGRDRIGEKPLYYGMVGRKLLFASELKAICTDSTFARKIDRRALTLYARYSYIPAPYSIYDGFLKLPAGSFLRISTRSNSGTLTVPPPTTYWSAREVADRPTAFTSRDRQTDALEGLHDLLKDAVRLEMVADVPVGVFLSGGIDSSVIAAIMQAQSSRPINTFTIGFTDPEYDEAAHARQIATHLGTEHTELYVAPHAARDVIARLPEVYDEPFADESQIPTILISELAKREVTVALSGDGGDELFGGYERYRLIDTLWRRIGGVGRAPRRAVAHTIAGIRDSRIDAGLDWLAPLFRVYGRAGRLGDKLSKLGALIEAADTPEQMYAALISRWAQPTDIVREALEPVTTLTDATTLPSSYREVGNRLMFLDLLTYLPDNNLVKIDRASMSVGLEARVPLLDYRIVEWALRAPEGLKIRNGDSKWPLRQILHRYVPRSLFERPKMGFGVPIGAWLRGPLRDWAESLLSDARLNEEGFFTAAPIRARWTEHVAGVRNWSSALWTVLMFQAWLEHTRESRTQTVHKSEPIAQTSLAVNAPWNP